MLRHCNTNCTISVWYHPPYELDDSCPADSYSNWCKIETVNSGHTSMNALFSKSLLVTDRTRAINIKGLS